MEIWKKMWVGVFSWTQCIYYERSAPYNSYIAYLAVCLFLSRRIRLYPFDFGVFFTDTDIETLSFIPHLRLSSRIAE